VVLVSASRLFGLMHNLRVGVINPMASRNQQTLRPQRLRLLLLTKSEYAPLAYLSAVAHP
jgi:hypothetical protein